MLAPGVFGLGYGCTEATCAALTSENEARQDERGVAHAEAGGN